jgi:hypothetical protein
LSSYSRGATSIVSLKCHYTGDDILFFLMPLLGRLQTFNVV